MWLNVSPLLIWMQEAGSQIYDLPVEAERVLFADQSSNVFPILIF